jgi:UDP-2,3-diacylglucosamine pyrophosphatase LpxH
MATTNTFWPLQGGKNKNKIIIIICLNQSTVKVTKFWINSRLKQYLKDMYKILEYQGCCTCRIVLWMMHTEDTCGELWSRLVRSDISGTVNNTELYSHFFHTPKNQGKKDWRIQNRQQCVVTDLLKQNKCRNVCAGHLHIKVNKCTHPSEQYN